MRLSLSILSFLLLLLAPPAGAQEVDITLAPPPARAKAEQALFSESETIRFPLSLAYAEPIFRLPMTRFVESPLDPTRVLPKALDLFSGALQMQPATGQDWAFAHVYSLVTEQELAFIGAGRYEEPELVRLEVGQFYEVYSANAAAWLSGREAEPQWADTARLSRELALLEETHGHEGRSAAAIAVLLSSMFAHIAVDLPRCLLALYYTTEPRPKLEDMKADFFRMTPLFDQVSERLLHEGTITPHVLARLPRLLRVLLATVGVGNVVRLMRRYAWERFVWNAKRGKHEAALKALPRSPALLPLPSF